MEEDWDYAPDSWVLMEIEDNDQIYYKVLGGWSGGYLYGDSWRLNSGVTKVEEDDHHYYFHGFSGSVYKCSKAHEQVRQSMIGVYRNLINSGRAKEVKTKEVKDGINGQRKEG